MKFNNLLGTVLLLSVSILSTTSTLAAEAESSTSSITTSTSATASTSTLASESLITSSGTQDSTNESSDSITEEDYQEPILFKQTIHIQKVISNEKISNNGKSVRDFEGVNGAHFKIYDVSEILKELAGSKTGLDRSSMEKLTTDLTERSKKLSEDQLKLVTEGDTKTVDGVDGIFEYTLETNLLSSNAYYVVNSESPESATISEPFVFITPICDENGKPMEDVWYYPKSQPIEKDPEKVAEQDPEKEVKKVVSTGVKRDLIDTFFQSVINFFSPKG